MERIDLVLKKQNLKRLLGCLDIGTQFLSVVSKGQA
jgi:hypothetical protein